MASIKSLFTREAAGAGQVMTVIGPDRKPTVDTITVRGQDSQAFQEANRELRRDLLQYLEKNGHEARQGAEYQAFAEGLQRRTQASLVIDWSFDEPCTPANILELFTQAPYIADQVDEFAGKRERFASTSPKSCEPLPSINSDSPFPPPPAKK